MNINIGGKWIKYQSIDEIKGYMESYYLTLGNNLTLGDFVRLGNKVTLGKSPLYIASDLPFIFNGYNDRIQIGCKDFTVTEWIERYREIAIEAEITDESRIQKYYKLICFYDEWREK